jgi:hypothetical protein
LEQLLKILPKMTSKLPPLGRDYGHGQQQESYCHNYLKMCVAFDWRNGSAIGSLIEQISRFSIMATKIAPRKDNPLKEPTSFMSKTNDFI